ncbi:glycoside hydrolase family 88 protein [candidate division KSB1 bacterium]
MRSLKCTIISVFMIFTIGILGFSCNVSQVRNDGLSGDSYRSIAEDGAWCWFADPRAVCHNDMIYAGSVDSRGSIWVSKLDIKTGIVNQVNLHQEFNYDDHANPSILILQDSRIMVFYSAHGGVETTAMRYRISKYPEDITEWGDEKVIRTNSGGPRGFCYPNPVRLTGENNRIYLFWRGGNFKPVFSYSDDGENWNDARTLILTDESNYVRPYLKVSSNGKDRIHFAFTDGHPRNEPENCIYYAYYRKGEFFKADGVKIGGMKNLPITHSASDQVYNGKTTGVRAWIWDVAADENDNPVIVYTRLSEETDHRYHYAGWDGTKWFDHEICPAGKWFPETPSEKKEPEPHYSGGIVLDHSDPSVVYLSRQVNGIFEIEKWVTNDLGATWNTEIITSGSTHNNVRPFVIRNRPENKDPQVLWMYNHKYVHYTDYRTSIKMNKPMQELSGDLDPHNILTAMKRAADWQINNPGEHHPLDWTSGALYTGMTAWGLMSDDSNALDFLVRRGNENGWNLGRREYHADDHCVGWTYLELYLKYRQSEMIDPLIERFDWILENPSKAELEVGTPGSFDRWCWCDALFMSPPVWAKLAALTGKEEYLEFMNNEFWFTTDYLYDKDEHLYYRDSRYFTQREANNRKLFWSRGNGWVIAGIARILENLPADYPDRNKYIDLFKEMAYKLVDIQPPDGLWRPSLLDPESYSAQETSGSGFFCYALAWGINQGILDKDTVFPAVKKAWKGLVDAVHLNGMLGFVQPVGQDPRKVTKDMTEIYGVGAFLLAGSEVYKLSLSSNNNR